MQRRAAGLATYKQVRTLRKFGVPDAHLISFNRASAILDRLFSERFSRGDSTCLISARATCPLLSLKKCCQARPYVQREGSTTFFSRWPACFTPGAPRNGSTTSSTTMPRQCGRHVPESEITASIRRSRPYAWNGQTHSDTGAFTPRPTRAGSQAAIRSGSLRTLYRRD